MIRHLFKLIWTQRRFNVWIVLELFVVSTLMWYIVDYLSVLAITASTPTGFNIENTYKLNLALKQANENGYVTYEEGSPEPYQNMKRIEERLRRHPDIEGVSVGEWHYPYCRSNSNNSYWRDTLRVNTEILTVTPDSFRVFPGSSAIGGFIFDRDDSLNMRVAGVTTLMKRMEFSRPACFLFMPLDESDRVLRGENDLWSSTDICFRVKETAATVDFAERFAREMRPQLQVGNFYLSEITPLSDFREEQLEWVYSPLRFRFFDLLPDQYLPGNNRDFLAAHQQAAVGDRIAHGGRLFPAYGVVADDRRGTGVAGHRFYPVFACLPEFGTGGFTAGRIYGCNTFAHLAEYGDNVYPAGCCRLPRDLVSGTPLGKDRAG